MKRCAFLTRGDDGVVTADDACTHLPLRELGWRVEAVPWRRGGIRWHDFDAVVIRSTWDYQDHPDAFIRLLKEIADASVPLLNSLGLVEWNLRKTYLRQLAARGLPTIPTIWREKLRHGELATLFDRVGACEIVVKPVIGAGAGGTFRLNRADLAAPGAAVESFFANRALMVQPLARSVLTDGEYSLLFFGGEFSHCVLKTAKPADFRVQQEHGGQARSLAADAALRAAGSAVIRVLDEVPLYARVDLVRANDAAEYWLMELELIEPSLFFATAPDAARRFALALHRRAMAGGPA